jgi:hypothetical protein
MPGARPATAPPGGAAVVYEQQPEAYARTQKQKQAAAKIKRENQ